MQSSIARILLALLVIGPVPGCVSVPERNPLPEQLVAVAEIPGVPRARHWGDEPPDWTERWFAASHEQMHQQFPALFGHPHTYLALSGGGANGAYGAGLLVGWTAAGDRPEFAMVTGISTGALIAPFAFLGPEYDDRLREVYTTHGTEDIVKKRGRLAALTGDAAASSEPLQRLLVRYVDEAMMEAIAEQHRRGRRLLVATTNLDSLRPVTWNIGQIASSGRVDALQLIHQVLLASASIPGAMPPVLIEVTADGKRYDELHVDGGAASQVFLYPVGLDWERVKRHLEIPGTPELYVIRNSRLKPDWEAVKNKLMPIMGRTASSLIRTQGLGDLYRIYLLAERDGLRFHLTTIPDEFDEPEQEAFDPIYMQKLFELGYRRARDGYPWQSLPPAMQQAEDSRP